MSEKTESEIRQRMTALSSGVDKHWQEIAKLADRKVGTQPGATAKDFAITYGYHLAGISANLREMASVLRMQSYSLEKKMSDLDAALASAGQRQGQQ